MKSSENGRSSAEIGLWLPNSAQTNALEVFHVKHDQRPWLAASGRPHRGEGVHPDDGRIFPTTCGTIHKDIHRDIHRLMHRCFILTTKHRTMTPGSPAGDLSGIRTRLRTTSLRVQFVHRREQPQADQSPEREAAVHANDAGTEKPSADVGKPALYTSPAHMGLPLFADTRSSGIKWSCRKVSL